MDTDLKLVSCVVGQLYALKLNPFTSSFVLVFLSFGTLT